MIALGTKAETLERLSGKARTARILPLTKLAVADWRRQPEAAVDEVMRTPWGSGALIVRSSAKSEDGPEASQAGRFLSVPNVAGREALHKALADVVASYDGSQNPGDQILVQPMLASVGMCGVAFTRDPNTGAPYVIVNYDRSGDSSAVTGGRRGDFETYVYWKRAPAPRDPQLAAVMALARELEELTGVDSLDIEFAFDVSGELHLLQVRHLKADDDGTVTAEEHGTVLESIAQRIDAEVQPHPFLHGDRTVFGVMPDWNPAEIIGIRPRPLALSLYRDLVTDATWAYQRNNYGYKNLRSFPLLVHFHGLPYIDVRVSFNSFVPRDIEGGLADRLVNYYIDRLIAAPSLHDKVEFEIIFSCYTLDLPERLKVLERHGFSTGDTGTIAESLRRLTNTIIHSQTGLWRQDLEKLKLLDERRAQILDRKMDRVARIYWLLEDCKRYGTLPFAGLARAGFIAVQLLRSLVSVDVLSEAEYGSFLNGLDTVSSRLARDFHQLDRTTFLQIYGHLRPGTYDILSPRYDEAPDLYFDWSRRDGDGAARRREQGLALGMHQMRQINKLLGEHGLQDDIVGLFNFLQAGIEGREYAKFVFCRNLSCAISLLKDLGAEHGLAPEDLSYARIDVIKELYVSSRDPGSLLRASIEQGKAEYAISRKLVLPPVITAPEDVWSFHLPLTEPNFVTRKSATAPVRGHDDRDGLDGAIVMIPNADPGFDWLFSRRIAGLITAYGGVNSHMAIRAGELGLPAVIGAGESLYNDWKAAAVLHIDCANHRVEVVQRRAPK